MRARTLTDRDELLELSVRLPDANDYLQSAGRLRWLLDSGRAVTVVIVEDGATVNAWAILERSDEGWAMWKGPGGFRPDPEVLSLLARAMRPLSPCMLVLDAAWYFPPALAECCWRASGLYRTSLVDVRHESDILRGMNAATRQRVLHAQREGAEVVADDPRLLDAFYVVYSQCMRDAGSPDLATYDEMSTLLACTDVHLFTVHHESKVIAGSVCNRNASSLEARYVATAFAHRAMGGLNLAHYAAMRWAHLAGLSHFDLSGIAVAPADPKLVNINRFKLGFGGKPLDYPIYR